MDVAAALALHHVEGSVEHLGTDGERVVAVVGVDDEVEGPAVQASRHLGVGHGVVVAWLPGHEAGEGGTAALRHVEPAVLVDGRVPVGRLGQRQELGDGREVALVQVALDVEAPHDATLPRRRRPVRAPGGCRTGSIAS